MSAGKEWEGAGYYSDHLSRATRAIRRRGALHVVAVDEDVVVRIDLRDPVGILQLRDEEEEEVGRNRP